MTEEIIGETVREIVTLEAPFGREIKLQDIVHESGLQMMRVRIREGSRFTILEIDPKTAKEWGANLVNWAQQTSES